MLKAARKRARAALYGGGERLEKVLGKESSLPASRFNSIKKIPSFQKHMEGKSNFSTACVEGC